ncbi:uncharacterized protein LOC129004771 [Macrosteles quadrilineatus]|uniref:uncharacterized protein LOC129004771 n=1 Tax=Macrosteles quadrilineatus TaxID=74068 RepID=UPI0023E240AE|nr:uncharacterized protein LOC129004771 [Macrosteles quadrilineatus]
MYMRVWPAKDKTRLRVLKEVTVLGTTPEAVENREEWRSFFGKAKGCDTKLKNHVAQAKTGLLEELSEMKNCVRSFQKLGEVLEKKLNVLLTQSIKTKVVQQKKNDVIIGTNRVTTNLKSACKQALFFVSRISPDVSSEELSLELAAVEVLEISTIIVAVYRSPDGDLETFFQQLDNCLQHLLRFEAGKIVICGDFNIHLERPSREEATFANLLRSHGLYITSRLPTRGEACLDAAATNIDSWDCEVEVKNSLVADQDAVVLRLTTERVSEQHDWLASFVIEKRLVSKDDFHLFYGELEHTGWDFPNLHSDPEGAFHAFFSTFKDKFDEVFPVRVFKPNTKLRQRNVPKKGRPSIKEWYTPELAKMRALTLLFHDHYKAAIDVDRKERFFSLYCRAKRDYSASVKEAKKLSNVEQIRKSHNTCKAAWEIVNEHRKPSPGPKIQATPDELNDYFVQVAESVIADLPVLPTDPTEAMIDRSPARKFAKWREVSPAEVLNIVKRFKDSKSQDIHGMSSSVLKAVIDTIVVPLTKLVNACLSKGIFPDSLKTARTIPIYKKGDPKILANFRPISILPIFSKVFETIMKKQLVEWLETHDLLNNAQHGFRSGRSTTTALLNLAEIITDAFENSESVQLDLCDLSKAFDVVSHDILVAKLSKYGISGMVLKTLAGYLEDRKQIVSLSGASSRVGVLLHGVPQGSVLGPLLFTVMVNDLSLNGHTLLFADDTTLFSRGRDLPELKAESEQLLTRAKEWFISNKLKINEDKTQSLICTLKTREEEDQDEPVKLLGFWIDSKCSWSYHIEKVCVKLSRVLYLFRKLRSIITQPYLKTVYHSLFHSHIMYGLVLWGHAPAAHDVLLLQKKALRIITSSEYTEHCRPIFKDQQILTIYSQYIYDILILLKEREGEYSKREYQHSYNTRRAQDLDMPRCRLSRTLRPLLCTAFSVGRNRRAESMSLLCSFSAERNPLMPVVGVVSATNFVHFAIVSDPRWILVYWCIGTYLYMKRNRRRRRRWAVRTPG